MNFILAYEAFLGLMALLVLGAIVDLCVLLAQKPEPLQPLTPDFFDRLTNDPQVQNSGSLAANPNHPIG